MVVCKIAKYSWEDKVWNVKVVQLAWYQKAARLPEVLWFVFSIISWKKKTHLFTKSKSCGTTRGRPIIGLSDYRRRY